MHLQRVPAWICRMARHVDQRPQSRFELSWPRSHKLILVMNNNNLPEDDHRLHQHISVWTSSLRSDHENSLELWRIKGVILFLDVRTPALTLILVRLFSHQLVEFASC